MAATDDPTKQSDTLQRIADQRQHFRDLTDVVRKRTDSAAKTLGALALTLLPAVAISKFGDIYPLPPVAEGSRAVVGVIGGFILMGCMVALLTKRLWRVNEPVLIQADVESVTRLRKHEKKLVNQAFDEMARINDVASLRAYEARAWRFQRVAELASDTTAKKLRDDADMIQAEVGSTLARANTLVVRRRASEAVASWVSFCIYVFFVLGALAFAIGSDYLQNQRADQIALAKGCAAARTADGANEKELPETCEKSGDEEPARKVTPEEHLSDAVKLMSAQRTKCLAALDDYPGQREVCERLAKAIVTANTP